jgi:hypothetical protein
VAGDGVGDGDMYDVDGYDAFAGDGEGYDDYDGGDGRD